MTLISSVLRIVVLLTLSFLFLANIPCWGQALAFASHSEGQQSPIRSEKTMRIMWRISQYKIGKDATMGEKEAHSMLFKPLDIGKEEIVFDGRICRDVIFKKRMKDVKEYLENAYGITPKTLGIDEETVEVVKSNCDLPGFAEYMRLRDRRLVIQIKGIFFFFEPVVNR